MSATGKGREGGNNMAEENDEKKTMEKMNFWTDRSRRRWNFCIFHFYCQLTGNRNSVVFFPQRHFPRSTHNNINMCARAKQPSERYYDAVLRAYHTKENDPKPNLVCAIEKWSRLNTKIKTNKTKTNENCLFNPLPSGRHQMWINRHANTSKFNEKRKMYTNDRNESE